jgi:predicted TIM-barrel fold metal-dependent hydrolase
MVSASAALLQQDASVRVSLVDADVHPTARSPEELRGYLAEPWRSRPPQALADGSRQIYFVWGGGQRADAYPASGGPAGSDPDLMHRQLLEQAGVDFAMLLPIVRHCDNPQFEAALCAATNAWVEDRWLGAYNKHGRYRAAINVCADLPRTAVAEIERWAGNPYFSQVRINTYTEALFGDERYHPIYEAATRHRLPVSVHFAKSTGVSLVSPAGFPRSYFEIHSLLALDYAAHLTSLIMEGVFEKYPDMKFVFIEGGFAWLLPLVWRMDKAWQHLKAEVPWLTQKPSGYVRRNVRFTTQPIEEPEKISDLFRTFDLVGADDILMFSTDYPHWDFDNPKQPIFRRLPKPMREKIMYQSALDVYGLPTHRAPDPPVAGEYN